MRKVESSIIINCKPEQVIAAFLDHQHLQNWWGVERSLVEKKRNGVWALAWQISDQGIKYVSTGIISTYEASSWLVINNLIYFNPDRGILGPMQLKIEVERIGRHDTKIVLTQSGYQDGEHWDWYYEAVLKAWPVALRELKKYLER